MLRRSCIFSAALALGLFAGCSAGSTQGSGGSGGTGSTTTSTSATTTSSTGGTGGAGGGSTSTGDTGGAGGIGGAGGTGGMAAACGDGLLSGAEACDDGNTADGDGCSVLCAIEDGYDCNGEPSVCVEPPCEGVSTWSDATNVFPACFKYVIDANFDANNCEFYIDAFGRGSFSAGGASGKWLQADLKIGTPDGALKNAGMLTRYLDNASVEKTAWSLGSETSPGAWRTGFTWERTGLGPGSFSYTVLDFAFFIDVQRMNGDMVRLWISNAGANYTVAQTYAVPGQVESMGATTIEYAADQAALFDQKHACLP